MWAYLLLGLGVAISTVFVAGAYFGQWMVRNQGRARLEEALHSVFSRQPMRVPEVSGDWLTKDTQLVRLETSEIYVANPYGSAGGIQALDDGRILYAGTHGQFWVIGTDGITKALPFSVDMNFDALKQHPAFQLKNFNYTAWFRVTGINLKGIGGGRYELLVGHHHFNSSGQCIELRLSRAVLTATGADLSLAEPFRAVLTTTPCITFNHPGYENAFEGHFSGGKIARIDAEHVLFSTGDHGWVGVRGYPAVSQDDGSTLGKILLVDVSTNDVRVFAKGVRNPQGLTIDSKGRIWETEQGPRGGDELNLIVKDQNYGWPYSTYGTDYGPRPWPLNSAQGRHDTGIPPEFAWNPSIAASGIIEVAANEFPLWKGDLLVASLGGEAIHRLRLEGTRVEYDEPISFEGRRLRDIIELPAGRLAVLTDRASVIVLRNADVHGKAPYLNTSLQQRLTTDMPAQERSFAVAGRYARVAHPVAEVAERLPASSARGELLFKQDCAACHSVDTAENNVGPELRGVVGRRAGAARYAYSDALLRGSEVWTARTVVDFAANPAGHYAGTKMKPVPLGADDRRDLESYLNLRSRVKAEGRSAANR
jgi:cytochrome c2